MGNCRECGAKLVVGQNWYPSLAKTSQQICIECKKRYQRQHYETHRKEKLDYQRQHYEIHRKEKLDYQHQYYKAHRKEKLVYQSQYQRDHPDRARVNNRRWRKNNPDKRREYLRCWQKAHPDKVREYSRLRRALKANVTIGPVDEGAIYQLYSHKCIYCGATQDLELDHVVPLARSGAHSEDNLVVACRSCNARKNIKLLEEWLQTESHSRVWVI